MPEPSKYAKLQYATLICGEFFRDEERFGNVELLSPRLAERMEELRRLCFNVLGDISIAEAEVIRRKIEETGEDLTARRPRAGLLVAGAPPVLDPPQVGGDSPEGWNGDGM